MKTAYLDCIGGISGDMLLGALLDTGVDREQLVAGLRTLNLPPWELRAERVRKSGIAGTHVEVVVHGEEAGAAPLLRLPPNDEPLTIADRGPSTVVSHTHEHTHSHEHGHTHTQSHTHASSHSHEHTHVHEPASPTPNTQHLTPNTSHTPTHPHTHTSTFDQVAALIRASQLPELVKERAVEVYRRLAAAEAAVHGTTLERVHFHEVGAVDSIVDVVGAVYGLHLLGVERVLCSPLPTGKGFVRCAHGLMPVPPPATMELLQGCPLRPVDVEGELVTPTGAALASTLAEGFGGLPGFTVAGTGYGAGRKDFPFPNLLRIVLGDDATAPAEATEVTLVEANIDDQSPQLYESVMAALFAAGALDVWLTPILMKKGRPAQTLHVLCKPGDVEAVSTVIFRETTSLGVRYTPWKRSCLQREWVEVATPYGAVRVKVGRQNGELRTASPEYEDCRARAAEAGVPVKQVHAAALAAAYQLGLFTTEPSTRSAGTRHGEVKGRS